MSQSRELEQERRLNMLERRLRTAEDRVAEALQALARGLTGGGAPAGGGPTAPYYCIGSGSSVASGYWPSLGTTAFTSDVYKMVGSGWELVESAAVIYWPYKDAVSGAGRLIACWPNEDGSGYNGVLESCVVVTGP